MTYADAAVLVAVEVVTMMTKKLQRKKPGITKGIECTQGHAANKGQS